MNKSKRIGALLSYAATIINSLVSIFLTPFILASLGDSEYGVYRTIQSLTGQLALMSIGIGTIASVYIARYNARNDEAVKKERENFVSLSIGVAVMLSMLVIFIGLVLYCFVDELYANTMSVEQIKLAQDMFIVLVINVALYMFRDVFHGIINGYERFIYANSLKVPRLLIRVVLIAVLLSMGYRSMALVCCDLAITVALLLCDMIYCFGALKLRPRFYYFDKRLFKSLFSFSAAMLLQTIVNQVNQNLDGVILGATVAPERVAVYSLALTIYVAFNGMISSVAALFTPEAARLVQKKADRFMLMDFVVRVGRIQGLVICLVLGGFIAAGQEFIGVWVGREKMDVYYLTLILLVPSGLAVTLTGANSLLDGYMKRMGRSVILTVGAVLNIVVSLSLIPVLDYWGAAVGTAVSVLIGQNMAMCIYYHKVFGFKTWEFIRRTFSGLIMGMFPAIVATMLLGLLPVGDLAMLLLKGVVFVTMYGGCLLLFGLSKNEKAALLSWRRRNK